MWRAFYSKDLIEVRLNGLERSAPDLEQIRELTEIIDHKQIFLAVCVKEVCRYFAPRSNRDLMRAECLSQEGRLLYAGGATLVVVLDVRINPWPVEPGSSERLCSCCSLVAFMQTFERALGCARV